MMVAVAVQSLGNLGFHAMAGRWLPPAEYGALGALLAATTALAVPLGALQAAASGVVARHGCARATALGLVRSTLQWSLLAAALLLPASPLLADWWHLGGWGEAALVLPYAVVSAVLATVRGLLLGASAPSRVAGSYLGATVVRVLTGVALTPWLGVAGALVATVLGELAALVVALLSLPQLLEGAGPRARLGVAGVLRPAVAVAGLFLLSTVDLLLARHYLDPRDSGGYVAAATVGKTVLALPAAALSVLYPEPSGPRPVERPGQPGRS